MKLLFLVNDLDLVESSLSLLFLNNFLFLFHDKEGVLINPALQFVELKLSPGIHLQKDFIELDLGQLIASK